MYHRILAELIQTPAAQAGPELAFNDHRVLRINFDQVLAGQRPDNYRGKQQQKGAGAHTLCVKCNNDTGSWYGGAYADWAEQAMHILIGTKIGPTLEYPFNIFPLRVIKQIVCMFFSVNGPVFRQNQSDLERFVLDRTARYLPKHIRTYAFFTFSDRSRAVGASALLKGLGSAKSSVHVFSEVTVPPFGFVMTCNNSPSPRGDLCEISRFSEYDYRDWRLGITLRLPLMPIYTMYPGDYRTRDEALREAAESECQYRETVHN